jgi:hypothetical protein
MKQLRACCVFRKNAIVVKGCFLRAAKSRKSQFEQQENFNFCQKFGHILPTHLISQHEIFFFPRLKEKLLGRRFQSAEEIGNRHCHKGNRTGPPCKYFLAVFPAAIPTLVDLHSGHGYYFEGGYGYV